MHLAVFGSGSGTTLDAVLSASASTFRIVQLFSDRSCRLQEIGKRESIPHLLLSPKQFPTRTAFDEEIVRQLDPSIDLILLAGYMRLVSLPLLQHFKDRIVNTHPADLGALTTEGKRKYIGADAVRMALEAGETRTRSCVILIDEGVDQGPVLVSGPWAAYENGSSASQHQQKQKQLSDYPACIAAIHWIAEGRIALDPKRRVYFDQKLQAPCGVDIDKGGEFYVRYHRHHWTGAGIG